MLCSEIIEFISKYKEKTGTYVEWSVNEKAAVEVAAGASYAGSRTWRTRSHHDPKKKLGWMDDSSEEELAIYILCCSDEYKELTPDEVIRKAREKNLHNFMRQLS